jgi:hypothetical protein
LVAVRLPTDTKALSSSSYRMRRGEHIHIQPANLEHETRCGGIVGANTVSMHAHHLIICKLLLPPEQLVFNYICVYEQQLNKSTPQLHEKCKLPSPNVLLVSGSRLELQWPRATTNMLLVKLHLWAKLGSTWTWSHDHQKRIRTLEKAMHPCKTVNKRFENPESLN